MTRLAGVVADGDRAAVLRALSGLLAATLDEAEPHRVAALSRELRETLAELDGLPAAEGRSASDDLAAKRERRRSAASSAPRPGRGGVDVGRGGGGAG